MLQLNNIRGGIYANQLVVLKQKSGDLEFKQTSNSTGGVEFMVPCNTLFEVTVGNYTKKFEMTSPAGNKGYAKRNLTYEPDMAEKDKLFAMSESEKAVVDTYVKTLPDTTYFKSGVMSKPVKMDHYTTCTIKITNLDNLPLTNEDVILTGLKRNKSIKGKTNAAGQITVYLPKGDDYSINFLYHKDYRKEDVPYSIGIGTMELNFSYMGTAEYLKRKKAEEERIKAEEERLAKEKAAFEKYCAELKISLEEGYKRKLNEHSDYKDNVVTRVLNRNKWSEKLIVCDLTGSMDPYAHQLSAWYQLNYKLETNLQFVFFNDGDSKSDAAKVIGSTGGIYYQPSKGIDSLVRLMATVRANGHGGDCPENNMEALIKGVKMAKPYKELVMIVDNNAPVKDIELLKSFNKPVHIILCGSQYGEVLLDYLLIAWKTKGTIHTIEEDISKIAGLSEGETIEIQGVTYKIMGGQFVRISKS